MLLISWRGIRQHPVQFLLSALAVVLGVAFITGTFALRTSLSSTFDGIVSGSYSSDVYVQPASSSSTSATSASSALSSSGVPISDANTIAALPEVASATPTVQGTGVLVGKDGTPVTTSGAPTLFFANESTSTAFSLVSGRMPSTSGEIAVESSALQSTGFAVGDTTKIVIGGAVQDVTIVGEVKYSQAVFGAIIVVVDEQTGLAAFAPNGTVPSIGVDGTSGTDSLTLAKDVAQALGTNLTQLASGQDGYSATLADGSTISVRTGDSLRADLASSIDSIVGFISIFLLVFAAIALFVGGFIIANTFSMSVRQRMREIAVLRAIGASPTQVFLQVVVQAAIIGLVGSVVGIAVGMGLVAIVRDVLASMGSQMASGVPLTTETVVVSLVVGLAVSVVAAMIPARRAATIPPVAAMRDEVTTESRLLWRGIVGAVLVAGGIASALAAAAKGSDGGPLLGLGAALLLIGTLVIAPSVVPLLVGALAWPLAKLWKPIGTLAAGNVVRNPRRTANTASALMIGMALVGGCAVLAASAQASVSTIVTSQSTSDLMLQNESSSIQGVPAKAVTAVQGLSDVGRADVLYLGSAQIGDDASAYFAAATPGTFSNSLSIPMTAGSAASVDDGKILIRQSFADEYGLQVGDTVTVATSASRSASASGTASSAAQKAGATSTSLTVGGIYDNNSIVSVSAILPYSTYTAMVPEATRIVNMVMVTAASGVSVDDLRSQVVDAVQPYYVVSVMNQSQLVSTRANEINQVLYILYALLGLSLVIAILGIINTLALSVIERTREIGLTRAVGLGRLQLAGTIVLESVYIAVFGAALGLGIGVWLASFLPTVLATRGFNVLAIPWDQLGWMVLLAAIVGVVAAVWPAVRAARMRVLTSIAAE